MSLDNRHVAPAGHAWPWRQEMTGNGVTVAGLGA